LEIKGALFGWDLSSITIVSGVSGLSGRWVPFEIKGALFVFDGSSEREK